LQVTQKSENVSLNSNLKMVFAIFSAGVGRTGCFIVIDSMLERMKTEATIDIYGHVTCLRAQRNYMVQTEEQYIFIHEALLESALCGSTEVTARNLNAHLATISQLPLGENLTKLQLEFKVCTHLAR
jgi:receptor-type tyrosine-protein phosphatase F